MRTYTGKQKFAALELLQGGKTVAEVSQEIDVPASVIQGWRNPRKWSETDRRRKDPLKPQSKRLIAEIVGKVMEIRQIEYTALLKGKSAKELATRSLAMAACAVAGVPLCHIARTFGKNWATIYSARRNTLRKWETSPEIRAEWKLIFADLEPMENEPRANPSPGRPKKSHATAA